MGAVTSNGGGALLREADRAIGLTTRVAGWWIGWIEEVPGVNCQERSRDKLLESLEVTLREALQHRHPKGSGMARAG